MLMLLGILYCRSNRKERAKKFYELVEIELTETIQANDPELKEYVPYLFEIPYLLMFRLYHIHRDEHKVGPDKKTLVMPDVNSEQYVPMDQETKDQILSAFEKGFIADIFTARTRIGKTQFEESLVRKHTLLMPNELRQQSFKKFSEIAS